jgi:hypothetical protein
VSASGSFSTNGCCRRKDTTAGERLAKFYPKKTLKILSDVCVWGRGGGDVEKTNNNSPIRRAARGKNLGERLVHFVLKAKTVLIFSHFAACGTFSTFLYGNGSHSNRATVTRDRAIDVCVWERGGGGQENKQEHNGGEG